MSSPPKVKPPRKRRKAAGRFHHGDLAEQLAVTAVELVEHKGHTAFSLREIAAKLGVTEPAIYRHYAGRDALLAEVALRGFERFVTAVETATENTADPFEQLTAFGREYVRFAVANAGWFRLQYSRAWSEELGRLPGVGERLAPAEAARQRFLARIAGAFENTELDAADIYRLLWGTAHGLAMLVVERSFQLVQTDEERIAAADDALRILVDSLRTSAEPR